MTSLHFRIAMTSLVLAACATTPTSDYAETGVTCPAANMQHLIGKSGVEAVRYTASLDEEATTILGFLGTEEALPADHASNATFVVLDTPAVNSPADTAKSAILEIYCAR